MRFAAASRLIALYLCRVMMMDANDPRARVDRLKEMLKTKLLECGWRDQLKEHCKGVSIGPRYCCMIHPL